MIRAAAIAIGAVLLLAACGGAASPSPSGGADDGPGSSAGSAAGPSAVSSPTGPRGAAVDPGGDVCGLLGQGDFEAVGISGAGVPTKNEEDASSTYCLYAGTSGATGGIELDVFVQGSESESVDVFGIAATELDDDGSGATALPDADDVALDPEAGGNPTFAAITVMKGRLVFGISFASSSAARDQLISLANLVLERASSLSD